MTNDMHGGTSDYVAALMVVAIAVGATMAGCGDGQVRHDAAPYQVCQLRTDANGDVWADDCDVYDVDDGDQVSDAVPSDAMT